VELTSKTLSARSREAGERDYARLVTARDRLTGAAVGFAFAAVCAVHPRLWRWLQKSERKALERPVWQRLARTVAAGVFMGAVGIYLEGLREELREEDPELFARIEADAAKRRRR
jgi:hypothetical protein